MPGLERRGRYATKLGFAIDRARRASQRKPASIQAINTLPVDGDFLRALSSTGSNFELLY